MRIYQRKITIISIRKPMEESVNQELQWLGQSLGLFNLRDKDKSCFRTFVELLKAAKIKHPLTSDQLAYQLGLSRGTVIHHINTLMGSGLVVREGNRYMLRVDNLTELIDELESDIDSTLKKLRQIAGKIDERLRL
ncbi:MAG: winged helix-turn-helix domain-containing protein [Nanoarchaeota archaeon]